MYRVVSALSSIDCRASEPGGAPVTIGDLRRRGFSNQELLDLGRLGILDLHRTDVATADCLQHEGRIYNLASLR
jgi:hypothetical protein